MQDNSDQGNETTSIPAGPQPRFDSMTGKKIKPASDAPRFDPVTGKRLDGGGKKPLLIGAAVAAIVLVGGGIAAAVVLSGDETASAGSSDDDSPRAEACSAELDPVYDALVAVDGRMTTGANISAFSDIVGEASSALNAVDDEVVEANDCAYADRLSEILVQYGTVLGGWNDCIFEYDGCDTDTDISVGVALSAISGNLEDLGSDVSGDTDPGPFNISTSKIQDLASYR